MCVTCGCALPHDPHGHEHGPHGAAAGHANPARGRDTVDVFARLLDANEREAAHNREHSTSTGCWPST